MSATTTDVACPKCGGPTWDNRLSKKNPKAPDYKCRDKACDGVIWPPKNGTRAPKRQAVSEPPEYGGPMPWEEEQEQAETQAVRAIQSGANGTAPAKADRLNALLQTYSVCFAHAQHLALDAQKQGLSVDVSAAAATLFIQASNKGIV